MLLIFTGPKTGELENPFDRYGHRRFHYFPVLCSKEQSAISGHLSHPKACKMDSCPC